MTSEVHEDSAVLLAIKDAELGSLRQQMAQLADDLRRNAAVRERESAEQHQHLIALHVPAAVADCGIDSSAGLTNK